MAAVQTAYKSGLTGPHDQIIKIYGWTSSHSQTRKKKLLEYFLEDVTDDVFVRV